jgi:hypothetical protein
MSGGLSKRIRHDPIADQAKPARIGLFSQLEAPL